MNFDIENFPQKSRRNRAEIENHSTCSCYFCLRSFLKEEVIEWVDKGETALCPHCGIDALIPGVVSSELLTSAKIRFFTKRQH
jgi:hypothetical protein